jgi:hypothetical protein
MQRNEIRLDIAELLQGEPTPAELLLAAAGNPVVQALLQMLRHERSQLQAIYDQAPSPIACMISTFGLAAEEDEDTIQAAQLCEMALSSGQSDTDGRIYLAYAGDNLASLFTESEIDPCEGLVGEALDRCQNVERLRDFGVTVGSASTDEFSVENLQTLNTTVENVGIFLANHANELGYDLTPEEAFQAVLGDVQFVFDNELQEREGQPGLTQGQIISLGEGAFYSPDTLIPAHELGHIFQNRLGRTKGGEKLAVQITDGDKVVPPYEIGEETPIVSALYVYKTGGEWYPLGQYAPRRNEKGELAYDEQGNQLYDLVNLSRILCKWDGLLNREPMFKADG